MKQGRPGLETWVSFLKIRLTKSNVDNWKKLKIGLTYVNNTIKDKRIIGAKNISDLYTWIDEVYDLHNSMRGHIGGTISMGYGIIHVKASKKNMNVRSSTESELVGMGKYVPYNIWFMVFMSAQGYGVENNVIY